MTIPYSVDNNKLLMLSGYFLRLYRNTGPGRNYGTDIIAMYYRMSMDHYSYRVGQKK